MTIDEDDIEILSAVRQHGGRDVLFSQVRAQTGFTRQKSRSRWSKLVDNGYIISRYSGEEGESERTATLSNRGRQALDALDNGPGDEDSKDEEISREELQEKVERLERRLNVLTSTSTYPDIEERVESLSEGLERTADDVSYLECVASAVWAHHSDNDDREFHTALNQIVNN